MDSLQVKTELKADRDYIVLFVNGTRHQVHSHSVGIKSPLPSMTQLEYLRDHLRLRGTKCGCGSGVCGACTVMITKRVNAARRLDNAHLSNHTVNACIYPLVMADGAAVTTVEGVGNTDNAHPVQERIAKLHGSQCGFCTPGFVMSLYAALRGDGDATRKNPPSPPSSAEMERACSELLPMPKTCCILLRRRSAQ